MGRHAIRPRIRHDNARAIGSGIKNKIVESAKLKTLKGCHQVNSLVDRRRPAIKIVTRDAEQSLLAEQLTASGALQLSPLSLRLGAALKVGNISKR
jgi:hypothetical protein